MKKLSLILLVFLFAGSVGAQNFLLKEDFKSGNNYVPPKGWTNITLSGDASIDKFNFDNTVLSFIDPIVKKYAVLDSYNGGSPGGTATNGQTESVALVTPKLSPNGTSNLYVTFDKQIFINNYAGCYLESSTDSSSWKTEWSVTGFLVEAIPTKVTVDLSAHKNATKLWLRFRWTSTLNTTYLGFFCFDNVSVFERYDNDVRVSSIIQMYDAACPSKNAALEVEVTNAGTITQTTIPLVLKVGTQTIYDTLKTKLASGTSISGFVGKTFDASTGGTFVIKSYSQLSTDKDKTNDTATASRTSSPPAQTPTAINGTRCGVGKVQLSATRGKGDSTFWYSAASGGSLLGEGLNFETPIISHTQDFYVANARLNNNMISSGLGLYRFNGSSTGPGSMFNVTAKEDILIDSLKQHFAYSGRYIVTLKYKKGTYRGSETNSAAWTSVPLVNDTIRSNGYGTVYGLVPQNPITMLKGETYGFYIDADITSITFTSGSLNRENSDIQIEGNTVLSEDHANVLTGYYWNGEVHFRKTCTSNRVAVKATILPLAEGAELMKGKTFDGFFKRGSAGDPDIVAEKKTIQYELKPPTGYNNSDFGVKWYISDFIMTTLNGTAIPAGDTSTVLPGTTNGSVNYTPSLGWADSTIVMNAYIRRVDNGCDTLLQRIIFVAPTPIAEFEVTNVCLGTPISFNNKSRISSGFMTYDWDFGDGNTSTFSDPIHNYTKAGKYNVRLTITSNLGIVKDTVVNLEVFEIPDVKFTVQHACEGLAVVFKNNTTISSGTISFEWDFGDLKKDYSENPSHKYDQPGGYKVVLKAFANGCSNQLTKNANQFPTPTAAFTVTGECSGSPVSIKNTSTIELGEPIGSYWDFGDGSVGTTTNPAHIYTTAGLKTIKLKAISQFGCSDSVNGQVTIKESPIADFTWDKACNIDPVNFTNKSTEPGSAKTIYSWEFGDGSMSANKNPSYKYTRLGEKIVTLTATSDNGCENKKSQALRVLIQPVAGFNVQDVCSGEPANFVNTTEVAGSATYKWYFGDNDSSTLNSPNKIYSTTQSQTYNVRLLVSVLNGCTDEYTSTINVKEQPSCAFTATQSSADRTKWTFTPANTSYGDQAYTWLLRGSKTYNVVSPSHTFEYTESDYKIILRILTPQGCECIDSNLTINTSWALSAPTVDDTKWEVYPNPTKDKVFIQSKSLGSEAFDIQIIDVNGKIVSTWNSNELDATLATLDVSALASGVYQITLSSDKIHSTKKLIINR
jgi:PKD repeat protein